MLWHMYTLPALEEGKGGRILANFRPGWSVLQVPGQPGSHKNHLFLTHSTQTTLTNLLPCLEPSVYPRVLGMKAIHLPVRPQVRWPSVSLCLQSPLPLVSSISIHTSSSLAPQNRPAPCPTPQGLSPLLLLSEALQPGASPSAVLGCRCLLFG